MIECKSDCLFNIDGKCTRQNKKDMTKDITALEKWKNDFKEFISELSMPEDDYYGIMQYIDEVPNETDWIPVSERLPKDNKVYLVTVELTFARGERYVRQERKVDWDKLKEYGHEVIAWMPLPESYKVESEE